MRLIPLLTALLIAAGLYYWFELRPAPVEAGLANAATAPAESDAADRPVEVPVEVVVRPSEAEETRGRLILRGRTVADRSVEMAAETTGRVVSPSIRRGAVVEKGQVLCELDPGTRAAELAEAEAALAEAEVLASGAAQLSAKGFASDTELKQREAQLRAAQARLDKVKADIEKLKIHAPFSGVLETDTAMLGTLLAPGAICAEVVDLDPITVEAFVAETEVGRLSPGQTATARLVDGMTAEGEVSFVSRMGDEETRTFAVEVTIPNPDRAIREGMTAEVSVALPPIRAHFVPQSALTLDDEGRLGVRAAHEGRARFHQVTILRETPEGVWIDGLPPKADIITTGQEFVRDGSRIKAVPASTTLLP